ncbi:hypothetical protein PMIN07_010592 [Paraphaeosphaeria minitans]
MSSEDHFLPSQSPIETDFESCYAPPKFLADIPCLCNREMPAHHLGGATTCIVIQGTSNSKARILAPSWRLESTLRLTALLKSRRRLHDNFAAHGMPETPFREGCEHAPPCR